MTVFSSDETKTIPYEKWDCVLSAPQSNIMVVFKCSQADPRIFLSDQPIVFGFLSVTNRSFEVFMLSPEYGYRIGATNETGQKVEKTRMGRRYGFRFDEVKASYEDLLDMTPSLGNAGSRPYWTRAFEDIPSLSRQLPAPQDLFKMDKPGVYEITLEVQCLYSDEIRPIRFAPVTLRVVKREPAALSDNHILSTAMKVACLGAGILWLIYRRAGCKVAKDPIACSRQ